MLEASCAAITVYLHDKATQHWEMLLNSNLAALNKLCRNLVEGCVKAKFMDWQTTELYRIIMHTATEFLNKALAEQAERAAKYLKMEREKVFTLDDEYRKGLDLQELQERRFKHRVKIELARANRVRISMDEDGAQTRVSNTVDPYQREVEQMAVSPDHKTANMLSASLTPPRHFERTTIAPPIASPTTSP